MGAKMTLQQLSELFARSNGASKKAAENFVKQLFDTVEEGLLADGIVKVKGWGTFKLVDIGARESVSVSTGERVLISGYKKVTFVPDGVFESLIDDSAQDADDENESDAMISETEGADEENSVEVSVESDVDEAESLEARLSADGDSEENICSDLDDKLVEDVVLTDTTEQKNDAFSGIDLLISTPECIEGAKEDLWKARNVAATMRAKAEQAINLAKNAEREVLRLESLIDRLEKNEDVGDSALSEGILQVDATAESAESVAHESVVNEGGGNAGAELRVAESESGLVDAISKSAEKEVEASVDACLEETPKSNRKTWLWVVLLSLLLIAGGACGYWFYVYGNGAEECVVVEDDAQDEPLQEEAVVDALNDSTLIDTLCAAEDADTIPLEATDGVAVSSGVQDVKANLVDSLALQNTQENVSVSESKQKTPVVKPDKYVLKEGETLTMLARRYYGSPDYVVNIINANNFSNPDNVHVGAVVILP